MRIHKTAGIYAKTLLDIARGENAQAAVLADLVLLTDIFGRTPELPRFFASPVVPAARKLELLKRHLFPHMSPITRKFAVLVHQKNRLGLLEAMAQAFIALEERSRNVFRATVTSAVPLSDQQLRGIAERLKAGFPERTYILNNRVDASLLGGFRVQQEDTVTDASLSYRLDQIRRKLAA